MTGGVLGVSTYNSCVTIGFSESGISLAVMPPFGLFHHPLHVPWAGIEECVKKPTAGSTILVLVNLRGGGGFEVTGRAASALDAWWESRGAGSISH
jgi:hypothetical protein